MCQRGQTAAACIYQPQRMDWISCPGCSQEQASILLGDQHDAACCDCCWCLVRLTLGWISRNSTPSLVGSDAAAVLHWLQGDCCPRLALAQKMIYDFDVSSSLYLCTPLPACLTNTHSTMTTG